jgi:hypothetical protein
MSVEGEASPQVAIAKRAAKLKASASKIDLSPALIAANDEDIAEAGLAADSGRDQHDRRHAHGARGPPVETRRAAMSIAEFCWQHSLSEPYYSKLQKNGLGPKTIKLGARILITQEAAARWRRLRERKPVSVEALDKARRERQQLNP